MISTSVSTESGSTLRLDRLRQRQVGKTGSDGLTDTSICRSRCDPLSRLVKLASDDLTLSDSNRIERLERKRFKQSLNASNMISRSTAST
jgi:hypothetical protein